MITTLVGRNFIVKRLRSWAGLPCNPGACIRSGQFDSYCYCWRTG